MPASSFVLFSRMWYRTWYPRYVHGIHLVPCIDYVVHVYIWYVYCTCLQTTWYKVQSIGGLRDYCTNDTAVAAFLILRKCEAGVLVALWHSFITRWPIVLAAAAMYQL